MVNDESNICSIFMLRIDHPMQKNTQVTSRRLALMLLLFARGPSGQQNEPVEGRTRLTKMLFLLDKENAAFKRVAKLDFVPYAFGPYDAKLYDDLAFLENMGWLAGSAMSESEAPGELSFDQLFSNKSNNDEAFAYLEGPELDEADLSFEYLMGGVAENVPERYETRKYSLSKKGIAARANAVATFGNSADLATIETEIETVKRRYNTMPLRDFLRYVYKKYPESATDSTILENLRLR